MLVIQGVRPERVQSDVAAAAYRLDLRRPTALFAARLFPIHNKDIIYVSDSPATDLQKMFDFVGALTTPSSTPRPRQAMWDDGAPMSDSLVVGAPGVLAAWVHAIIYEALDRMEVRPEIQVLEPEEEAEFLGAGDVGEDRIFLCSFPHPSIIAKVAARAIPTLAVLDEPADTVRFFKQGPGLDWPFQEVMRASTLAHTIDRALFENPSVLIMHRGMDIVADEAVDLILQCLGLKLDDEALRELKVSKIGEGEPRRLEDALSRNIDEWIPIEDAQKHLEGDEAVIVAQALAPLVHYAFEETPPRVVWTQKLFLYGDKPDEPLPVVAELAGGARTIVYGPYLYLPRGRYRVSFVVGFSEETKGTSLVFNVVQQFGQLIMAEARCVAPGGGIFEGSFEISNMHSNERIEVIVRTDEGAIEGRAALVQVGFDLLPGEPTEMVGVEETFLSSDLS